MKALILTMFLSGAGAFAYPVIEIDRDNGVTWKSIFDAGFRPKHQPGLERSNTLWTGPEFGARVGGIEEVFRLGSGRLLVEVQTDATVRLIWHQSDERISLVEGERRVAEFREVFQPYVIQEITMPMPVDPSGILDAGNDENNIKARIGEWLVWYGFDSSLQAENPIVPHFYIAHSHPGRIHPRVANMQDQVEPPEGYEWYSLDPKVDTPDPGALTAAVAGGGGDGTGAAATRPERRPVLPAAEDPVEGVRSFRGLWVALLALVVAGFAWWLGMRKSAGR